MPNLENDTVAVQTLGCKVSQYESEAIAEAFAARGFQVREKAEHCRVVVINTCTVTAESDRKCRQAIHRAVRENPGAFIAVTGCYAQNAPEQIRAIPGVSYVCGSRNKMSVVEAAETFLRDGRTVPSAVLPTDALPFEPMKICRSERTRAYVKIEDGCENHCTYCAIPSARGGVVSKPAADVAEEVRGLVGAGYREVVLTGIEAASWGRDLGDERLVDLLETVDRIPGISRIRLGSLDPSYMKEDAVRRLAALRHLAPQFHLSMQSGADPVLRAMKRKYNRQMALDALARLRRYIPGVQFTTDLLFGFPGETEEDVASTLDFIRQARFLFIHIFPYSQRPGTPADQMPDQIPGSEKARRCAAADRLMREIRSEIFAEQTGREAEVLFETYQDGVCRGRLADFIEVSAASPIPLHGEFRRVRITSADENGCIGTLI